MANSVDPDQMPYSGSILFAKAYLSQYLGLLVCRDLLKESITTIFSIRTQHFVDTHWKHNTVGKPIHNAFVKKQDKLTF